MRILDSDLVSLSFSDCLLCSMKSQYLEPLPGSCPLYILIQNHNPSWFFFQYFIDSLSHSFTARTPLESWPFPALRLLNLSSSCSCLCASLAASSSLCAWQTARREGRERIFPSAAVLCATVASSCSSHGWNSAQPCLRAGHCRWAPQRDQLPKCWAHGKCDQSLSPALVFAFSPIQQKMSPCS